MTAITVTKGSAATVTRGGKVAVSITKGSLQGGSVNYQLPKVVLKVAVAVITGNF